jgi:hypothetical protein
LVPLHQEPFWSLPSSREIDFPCAGRAIPHRRSGRSESGGRPWLGEKLLALSKVKLLIVDGLGDLLLEPDAADVFFQLVSRRSETVAILITSNSVAERGTVLADPVVATAILGRLLQHSHELMIPVGKCRLRAKRNSGLLNAPNGPSGRRDNFWWLVA